MMLQKAIIIKQKEDMLKLEEEKKALYENHVKNTKVLSIQYKQIKQEKENKNKEYSKAQKEIEKQKKLQIIQQNKPKVEQRQQIEYVKIEQKQHQKALFVEYEVKNKERIQNAIENYGFRPKVEKDAQRLVQITESLQIKYNTKLDKADKVELSKVNGFNVNQLMKDMRYRLSTALSEAGLQNTDYGKDVLRYMFIN
ncbi:hypothetical protein IMG5_183070 [Ichthyophthirius multifiliis]|uniref:Uncharacterized protein n=1 Tax=Ichthyophthirius multifiliis TaxID=5932 RepID=G0R345_ICHMU|nr:hypothetical protein IMG5_183070 [Ichthyophthirius multifiliis]EGR28121.1 hypothetical protein IMG5_183070 [Ichthyophthirius multifiliis]|eukprot:XP_004027466.1 hypothetical protein IMG5_183070 [Ichthyophthirius multifiliis]